MTRGRHIAQWLACAALAVTMIFSLPCAAQHGAFQRMQQRPGARQQGRPQQQPRGHAGDWLRRYKDLPPAEQERALQNDPWFKRLPADRQQQLRQRLQNFSNLPPQRQLRVLNRMETWEHLTPEQKQQARQVWGQMQQLSPERRHMVHTAIDDLRAMPPQQRDQVIDSPRFKGMFSDQERELMRGASRLPLAPADSGDSGPEQ